jgi:hypothetical protein
MRDFEKYIGAKYPNRSPKILFQKFKDIDGDLFYGVKEIEDQAEVWNHQQAIINVLKAQLECCRRENAVLLGKVGELQNRLKAVYALSRMRASVISSWKREELSIKVRKAISYLAKKEKALRGEHD